MSQITNQSIYVIGIITAIVVIPKYLTLPQSLELLYHDKIGQLLLLVLAVVVASYNFTCGVLLALLFLSIMLQTQNNSMNRTEGFEDYNMDEDVDMKLNEDFNNTEDTTDNANTVPSLDELTKELKDSQKQLKVLENDLIKYKNEDSKTDDKTKSTETELEMNKKVEKAKKNKPTEPTKATKVPTKTTLPPTEMITTNEETIEGFGCGCGSGDGSSSRNDEMRIKLLKYEEASSDDYSLVEPFTNVRKNNKNNCFNPYDSVGCKFDVNYQPRNEFINGPPLSSCDAYLNTNLKQTGTVFYHLN